MKLHLKRTVFAWLVILTMMTAYPFAVGLANDQSRLAQLLRRPIGHKPTSSEMVIAIRWRH